MHQEKIDVSFIIIEYHSIEDVLLCVESIKETTVDLNYEVVISSNSQYNLLKQQELQSKHQEILWCFNSKNGGFAYGMNRGIEKCSGEFVIIQNPDTKLQNEKLPLALAYLRENKNIGILGPQILNNAGEIQDTCRSFVTPVEIALRLLKRKIFKKGAILNGAFDYNKIQSVDWVIGAYMITSRKNLEKVGLLNERFFMYVEDMEWCLRFWEKGLEVKYFPPLKINYEGDRKSTLGKNKWLPIAFNKYTRIHLKNYLIFLREHGHKLKSVTNL